MKASLLLVALVFFCVSLFASTQAVNPGFKVTLTNNGLNYARQVAIKYIEDHFSEVNIPIQKGTAHAPVIGKIDWELKDIIMSRLSLPQSSISILPHRGVQVTIGKASLEIKMEFHFHEHSWPHVSGSGHLVVEGSGIDIEVSVEVSESNGKPTLSVTSSQCHINNLKITEHGGPSWLYNFFLHVLSKLIRTEAEKAVGSAIQKLLNTGGNEALQTVPFQEEFGNVAEVDYSLVSGPTFGSNYLTLNAKGEFYNLPHKTDSPFTAERMPDEIDDQMMQVMLSDFVPNSASYVFRKTGDMTATLKDRDLPSWAPIRLNTSSWSGILPELAQKYPHEMMEAELTTSSPPTATFSSHGIQVNGPGQIVVSVLPRSGAVPVFALNINVGTSAEVTVVDGRIYAKLSYLNSSITVAWSHVGTINTTDLDHIIKLLSTDAIVPFFNYYLSHGINIPTIKGVKLVKPTIHYGQGYLAIASDISYNP